MPIEFLFNASRAPLNPVKEMQQFNGIVHSEYSERLSFHVPLAICNGVKGFI